ncbi:MAG: pantoate--beta-alanine ligase [Candidatus Dormibacteria bacterium]
MSDAPPRTELAVVERPEQLRELSRVWELAALRSGLVPTMGALHQGHLALIRAARSRCQRVVVSVFVNPRQFGATEDLAGYPRPLRQDLERLRSEGVDAAYCPALEVMYPPGFATEVAVRAAGSRWEAERRPGHFVGVATVMTKLLATARPEVAFLGEKDIQQVAVVTRLARDLDLGTEISVCPTVREEDGLACSSRNQRLSPEGRMAAAVLARALARTGAEFVGGQRSGDALADVAASVVAEEPRAELDYAGVVDPSDFEPAELARPSSRVMLAARVEGVRLIDNATLAQAAQLPC